ncbi:hypothetical protein DSO57_1033327 [Entomophthora muscae]|uniref:Uncharacterized protein n=1 Tax=Entomophthora muscae TaxID=34485 RepID=A0ACC2U9L6_9FUNG|nr:hypothetical protein DSO57_1033327 [Entomophthora muscae]
MATVDIFSVNMGAVAVQWELGNRGRHWFGGDGWLHVYLVDRKEVVFISEQVGLGNVPRAFSVVSGFPGSSGQEILGYYVVSGVVPVLRL